MRIVLYVNKFAIFGLEGESSFEARASDGAGLCPIVVGLDRWRIDLLRTGMLRVTKKPRLSKADLEVLLWIEDNAINHLDRTLAMVASIRIPQSPVGSLSYCQLGFSLKQWRLSWHQGHEGRNVLLLER